MTPKTLHGDIVRISRDNQKQNGKKKKTHTNEGKVKQRNAKRKR